MLASVSLTVIFLMAGLAFRSLLIPLRLILTVAVTLVAVGGATVLVFQRALGMDGVYWIVPLSCGCLVVGLTLDYDIFLIRWRVTFDATGCCNGSCNARRRCTSHRAACNGLCNALPHAQ